MEGKIYFRSRSGIQSLKHVVYTSDEIGVKYHQQLLGTRHLAIKKNAKLQRENQRNNKDCQSDVQTLYEICMALVVNNLDHVDSFYGLPSLIGEQIFDEALESDRFTNKEFDVTKLRLSIFMDAYGNEMFQRLNLSRQPMFLAQHIDEISLFLPYLHSVRLSNCGIGNTHEILFELGKLPQLECLCLDRNVIGDIGINNLLQLRRRNQQGLNNLQYLNLSDNKRISASSLFNLGLLPSLEALLISSSVKTVKTSKFGKFSMRCKNGANHIKGLNLNKFGNKNIGRMGCKLFEKMAFKF
uniref:uncharacterized protein LOC120335618 n=1 Tax=Styela clava TaxID=7725 RepID=UPI00193A3818|nr:uncharacterized protein LOC120335618 [Styela clava]